MSNTTDELDELILFMATLGWTYGKYDDQCFHVFDSAGNNTMTIETAKGIHSAITQAKKDLLEAIMEEMPDDEEIVEQRPGEVETFLHNQHTIGFNDCLTQVLAVIKEIEDEL